MSEPWVPEVGEVVETKIGGEWVAACVDWRETDYLRRPVFLYVRRLGKGKNEQRFPVVFRALHQVRKPSSLSPLPANVYADWLDDHGEPRAAKKLREAFPLGNSNT